MVDLTRKGGLNMAEASNQTFTRRQHVSFVVVDKWGSLGVGPIIHLCDQIIQFSSHSNVILWHRNTEQLHYRSRDLTLIPVYYSLPINKFSRGLHGSRSPIPICIILSLIINKFFRSQCSKSSRISMLLGSPF